MRGYPVANGMRFERAFVEQAKSAQWYRVRCLA